MADVDPAAVLDRDPWFASLDRAIAEAMKAAGRVRRHAAGSAVYHLGDDPNGLHLVIAGELRLLSYSEAGAQMVALVARAGDWFGELSTIDGRERPQDAIAAGEVSLFSLDQPAVERIAASHPAIWRAIGMLSCRHQRQALAYIDTLVSLPPRARIAAMLAGRLMRESDGAVLVSQDQIAAGVGLSRQTVNATLRDFERRGLVRRGYGRIEILDPAALRRIRAGSMSAQAAA